MKLTLVLGCVLAVCLAANEAAAVDLFTDGFESGDFATGGWTTQNGDASVSEGAAYTGVYGAKLKKATWIEKAVSTVGYDTIHVKYRRQTNGFDAGENLVVEWYDGSGWNNLETVQNADYSDGLQDKTCGAGADENADFKIRFLTNTDKNNESAYIDDVVVSGTSGVPDTDPPTPDPATFASAPAAISSSAITMTATTGSDASPPVEYYFDETSGNPGGSDSGWVTDPEYTDTGLDPNTQYTYTVQMRDSLSNTGAASTPQSATTPPSGGTVQDTANSDIIVAGTVTGSYTDTQSSDDGYESIEEIESGGKPSKRHSFLEHKWSVNVTGGDTVTFYVEAYQTASSDGDNFVFAYSTSQDGTYTDMVTVTKTVDDNAYQAYALPSATSGAVYIRVKDTDQTQGNKTLDTVYIDHMYIESTGGQPDTDPPTPDPATFASPPAAVSDTEITMAATTGSDASPPVEYYFDETSGNPGGSDSGWVTNPAYNDTGLQGSTQYTYTVQMRDSLANTGTASAPANATTDPTPDTDPPTPDPATFASPPAAVSSSEIIMTATAGSDASPPVEYFFDETSGNPGGTDSGWVTDTTYNDTGLDANTTYTYTVQMRDSLANTGTASAPANATTDPPPPDTDPPTPDPATFASAPAAVSDTEITMTATTGSDASPPVEYYFDETSGNPGGDDSGWVTNPVYNDTGLDPDTTYTYTVQMRDSLANTGTASAPADATTDPAVPMTYHWKLDETSAGPVVDDEGNLDITNYGCTINQPGDPEVPGDLSYLFDSSTTDYIGTGSTTLVPQTGDWRADVTFMTTFSHPGGSPTDQGHLFGNNDGVDNNRGAMYIQDGTLHYWQKNGPSITGDSVNMADGEWHKATIERVGSTFTLYRDGQNAGSDTYSGNMGQNTEWVIGHSAPGSSNPYDFQGNISDVVLYDSTFVPEPNTVLIDYTNVTMSGALGGQGWQERIDLDSEPRALPRGWGSLGGDLLIPNSPPVPGTSYATQNGWDATYISNDELIFTFDRTYDLDSMRVWNYNKASRIDRSVQNVTIEYSTNGTDWTTLKSTTWPQGSGDTSNIGFVESLGVSAKYVKFTNMTTYGNSRIGLMGTSFFAIVGGSESDPPTPNPATFDTPPTAISQSEITMTATTGTDASPPIEYYFAETSGNPGATDSGWQTDTTYTDIGLQPLTEYTYTVQMRDNQLNTGTASAPASETTPDGPAPIDWTLITMDGGLPGQGWDERIHYDGGEDHDALVQGWMDKDGGNPLTTPHSPPLPTESTASTEHAFDAAVVSGDTLIFTLDRIYAIESMWVWNTNRSGFTNRGVNNVTIEYSTNGTSWNTLRSTSWAQAPGTAGYIGFSEDFGSNSASYVRFSSMTNHGGNRIGLSGVSFIATALPAMSFASAASNALENTGPAQIEVVLTDAPAGETYTVDYDVIGGTATGGGVDYTLANGTLTFDNNSVSEFITIDIVDDPDDEDDETIIIELSNPTGLNATLAEPTQHTYTIEDERPDVYFDLAQSKGDESVTPVNLAVSLDANATETITVDYAVVAGTATTPEDYTIAAGPLTFNVGENTKNIVLNIVSDAVQEGREYIYVQLQNPVNAVLGSTIEHRYQINGNGIWWESSFWYFRWTNADRLQVNRDGDWEWDPEGDDYLMTRIADEDLSQEGQIVQRTWYWLSDGDHECPDCFDCGLYCFDDDITCIAGTSDIRLGFFQSDGVNFPTQDGYSHDTCGYRGFAWRFGPNMKSGPTRWVDCQDETHKTGMYSYVPVGQCDLLSGNENLGPGIPGFETPPGEWTTAIFKLQRFGGDIRLTIELNGRSYDWTRSDLGTSKIDIISMGMRNSRHYDRIVLSTP